MTVSDLLQLANLVLIPILVYVIKFERKIASIETTRDEVFRRLERIDESWATVVEMRFFGGLSVEETAANLGVSEPTVRRTWNRARAWLVRELSA